MTIERSNEPDAFHSFEYEGWETVSAGYERHWAKLTRQAAATTLDAAGVGQGLRVLDVCTGPGTLADIAVRRGARVQGVDFSTNVIEIARRNVPGARFHEGDAQDLSFEDSSFDAVVCGFGVIHLPNPEDALSEMLRVLRPGGRFATSVWAAPETGNGFGLLYGAIHGEGDLSVPLPHGPDFFQFSDPDRFKSALQSVGFRDVTVRVVEQTWELDEPMGALNAVLEGGVRARALLLAQTETVRRAISDAVANGMERYRTADGLYQVPMPALVGAGMR